MAGSATAELAGRLVYLPQGLRPDIAEQITGAGTPPPRRSDNIPLL